MAEYKQVLSMQDIYWKLEFQIVQQLLLIIHLKFRSSIKVSQDIKNILNSKIMKKNIWLGLAWSGKLTCGAKSAMLRPIICQVLISNMDPLLLQIIWGWLRQPLKMKKISISLPKKVMWANKKMFHWIKGVTPIKATMKSLMKWCVQLWKRRTK